MKKIVLLGSLILFLSVFQFLQFKSYPVAFAKDEYSYWLKLYRKSDTEFLYFGEAGNIQNSQIIKIFKVNSGVPDKKPTPLPYLLGRKHWVIKDKQKTFDSETAPYFLTLDIPVSEEEPFGPLYYPECGGNCNWEIPGAFGLHGINGDEGRLLDPGSSGCVRHKDSDVTFLYYLLNINNEVRYYIEDI